jgi:hypothetical protein
MSKADRSGGPLRYDIVTTWTCQGACFDRARFGWTQTAGGPGALATGRPASWGSDRSGGGSGSRGGGAAAAGSAAGAAGAAGRRLGRAWGGGGSARAGMAWSRNRGAAEGGVMRASVLALGPASLPSAGMMAIRARQSRRSVICRRNGPRRLFGRSSRPQKPRLVAAITTMSRMEQSCPIRLSVCGWG